MEDTTDNSQPVEIYEFNGTYQTFTYTSDNLPHTTMGQTFVPIAGLERSNLKIGTQEDDRDELTVSMPVATPVAANYAFQTTPPRLSINIWRMDRSGGSVELLWKGPVSAITVSKHIATFRCPSNFSNILQARVPTIMVQPQCNHVLYDERCKVSRSANRVVTTVTAINGRAITLASTGSFPTAHFIGGEMVATEFDERRSIVQKSGNVVTVSYLFGKLEVGDPVEIVAGCDHGWFSSQGCPKFSNQENFGGFPFTPGESNNVFVVGLK